MLRSKPSNHIAVDERSLSVDFQLANILDGSFFLWCSAQKETNQMNQITKPYCTKRLAKFNQRLFCFLFAIKFYKLVNKIDAFNEQIIQCHHFYCDTILLKLKKKKIDKKNCHITRLLYLQVNKIRKIAIQNSLLQCFPL